MIVPLRSAWAIQWWKGQPEPHNFKNQNQTIQAKTVGDKTVLMDSFRLHKHRHCRSRVRVVLYPVTFTCRLDPYDSVGRAWPLQVGWVFIQFWVGLYACERGFLCLPVGFLYLQSPPGQKGENWIGYLRFNSPKFCVSVKARKYAYWKRGFGVWILVLFLL